MLNKDGAIREQRLAVMKWVQDNESEIRERLTKKFPMYADKLKKKKLTQLQHLENIERVFLMGECKSCVADDSIKATSRDYREIDIEPDSVVYCDIPYRKTTRYVGVNSFDYEAFYEWAHSFTNRHDVHIFISEYDMP